jgi:hypothetical protein
LWWLWEINFDLPSWRNCESRHSFLYPEHPTRHAQYARMAAYLASSEWWLS